MSGESNRDSSRFWRGVEGGEGRWSSGDRLGPRPPKTWRWVDRNCRVAACLLVETCRNGGCRPLGQSCDTAMECSRPRGRCSAARLQGPSWRVVATFRAAVREPGPLCGILKSNARPSSRACNQRWKISLNPCRAWWTS